MPVNYQLGKIYRVVNSENAVEYIGSTAQTLLSSRMAQHRRDGADLMKTSPWNVAVRTLGAGKFKILLMHTFPCNSKAELEAEEYRVLNNVIAAGTSVYNSTIDGKHSEDCKTKRSLARKARGEVGEKSPSFDFGTVCRCTSGREDRWVFRSKTPAVSKSFSINKYGFEKAKALAEAERKKVYPDWKTDEERAAEQLLTLVI